jgi:hypothetical protein
MRHTHCGGGRVVAALAQAGARFLSCLLCFFLCAALALVGSVYFQGADSGAGSNVGAASASNKSAFADPTAAQQPTNLFSALNTDSTRDYGLLTAQYAT